MFEWVRVSSVDQRKHQIYNTLWAYKIKIEERLKFQKLNPRWCLKGGTMDRGQFKAHAETLRMTSYRIILACKAGYWHAFTEFLLDCSDAFQSTRTDGGSSVTSAPLYCYPAPGFEKRDEQGERLCCKVNVAMQGRIDATRLFNTNLFVILVEKAGMMRLLWDKQMAIYHHGPHENSSESLSTILMAIKTATDTTAQQAPVGYAVIGFHVDDGMGVACSVGWIQSREENRVIQYIKGTIEVTYATTMTGWHGRKSLGYALSVDNENERVSMSAIDAVDLLAKDLLKNDIKISPKHITGKEFEDVPMGMVPDASDPARVQVMAEMGMIRHALGVLIWVCGAHPQALEPVNKQCSTMQAPSGTTGKNMKHITMHLLAHRDGITFGAKGSFGLEQPDDIDLRNPWGEKRFMFMHWFADANLTTKSTTGGVGMLAGGCMVPVSQRQHLKAPCAHTVEVVGAGTNFSIMIPVQSVLQELHIGLGKAVPMYLDSLTTVYVATSDTAIKKSVWLIRRAAVLEDGVTHGMINPIHISEKDMVADPLT